MIPEKSAPLPIRMIRMSDGEADAYARHIVAHMAESGRAGMPHFALSRTWVRDEIRSSLIARLAKPLDEPLWGRAWGLFDGDEIVGHIELRGGRVPAEMHRATLGMGIMRAHTAQGNGRRLIEVTARWARDVAKLDWIDLGVFADNAPARKLYQRMGFVEIGVRKDAFHLDSGVVVDDVLMVLRL
ncbi:MAG: GNAT family N-acetyltransferase [Minicystis sp.]